MGRWEVLRLSAWRQVVMTEWRKSAKAIKVLLGVSSLGVDLVSVLRGADVYRYVVVVVANVARWFLHVIRLLHWLNWLFFIAFFRRWVCGLAVAWLCKFGAG